MSISVAGMIGAAAAAEGMKSAGSNGSHWVNSASDYYWGGKSEKRSNERSEEMTKDLMNYEALLDAKMASDFWFPQTERYQERLYDWSSRYDYDMARRYGENSASWMVEGLRRAGLNPILAATDGNFRSTYGNGGSMPSAPSVGGGSRHTMQSAGGRWASPVGPSFDVANAVSTLASAKSASVNSEIQSESAPYLVDTAKHNAANTEKQGSVTDATANKINAEATAIKANTAKTLVDIDHAIDHGGSNGAWSLVSEFIHSIMPDRRTYNIRDSVSKLLEDDLKTSSPHSAKSVEPLDSVRDWPIFNKLQGMLHNQDETKSEGSRWQSSRTRRSRKSSSHFEPRQFIPSM